MTKLLLGPVLSYRGGADDGEWRVSVLVGVESKAVIPKVTIEGKATKPPLVLLEYGGQTYLRYDLSCKKTKDERRIEYEIDGVAEKWQFTVPGRGYAPRMAYVSCNGFSDPSGSFGSDHVLDSSADDLKDHWTHDDHEGERKRLIETLLKTASEKQLRVSIVSGDVHVAAWGTAYRKDVGPKDNWAQIQQFTSTAVVHPSLVSVTERLFFHVLNSVAKSKQMLDVNLNAEMMLFPGSNRYVLPARNWLALELDLGSNNPNGAKLWATWRCETKEAFTNHLLATDPVHLRAE